MSIAIIGIGNMGSALARGVLAKDPLHAAAIRVYDSDPEKARAFCDARGTTCCGSAGEAVDGARLVVLAVKPNTVAVAIASFRDALTPATVLVSIAAGTPLSVLRTCAGPVPAIARAMPNLPAMVGSGATAVCFDGADDDARVEVLSLFESVGLALAVEEHQMDAVTGLSGSSPAFAMLFLEALADAGVRLGLSRDSSIRLAAATVQGAARMVLETGTHPAVLKDQVCSPGGTTIEGILALEKGGFRAATIEAVSVAARRSAELAARSGGGG